MNISHELQIGKAGEHLVCCDLILQGYNVFLSDQGLPYDVLVDIDGKIKKIAVKSTMRLVSYDKSKNVYRFGTRKGKNARVRAEKEDVDYYAFVALDIRKIAYIPIKEMTAKNGKIKQIMCFKSRNIKYAGRVYSNGTIRTPEWGRYLQDYEKLIE